MNDPCDHYLLQETAALQARVSAPITNSNGAHIRAHADIESEDKWSPVQSQQHGLDWEHEAEALRVADWAADMASPDERHILHRALLNMYRLGRNHEAMESLARGAK